MKASTSWNLLDSREEYTARTGNVEREHKKKTAEQVDHVIVDVHEYI